MGYRIAVALGLIVLIMAASCASADEATMETAAQTETPGSRLHWSAGFAFVTESYVRGIAQENQDVIFQPWVNLEIDAAEYEGITFLPTLRLWNSLNTGPSGYDGPNKDAWYESDFWGGMAFEYEQWRTEVGYLVMFSPGGTGSRFAEEVNMKLAYDDTGMCPVTEAGFQPYILFAIETEKGRDGAGAAGNKGRYLEMGVAPSWRVVESEDYPVDFSVPVTLGLNVGDYYETATGTDNDETFGFVDLGFVGTMPLSMIPVGFGNWQFSAGVHVIFIGDSPKEIASTDLNVAPGDRGTSVYGVFAFEMTY